MSFILYYKELSSRNPSLQNSDRIRLNITEFEKQLQKAYNQGWNDCLDYKAADSFNNVKVKDSFSDIFSSLFNK